MVWIYGFRAIELVVVAFALGSAVVGLYIGWQAYRGLKRYESRQMLYLSVGMILVFGVAYATGFVGTLLLSLEIIPLPAQDYVRLAIRVTQFGGLLAIAYSLALRD